MSILPDSRYEKVHTGSAIETQRLQVILEENNIPSILRDDNESAKLAGYALASPDQSRLLVDKDHVMRAKHLIASALEDFDKNRISDEELENLSQREIDAEMTNKNRPSPTTAPKPSKGLLLFYVGYLVYAGWRFYPMITGTAEVSPVRILITGGLSVYCIYKLVTFFNSNKAST